MFWNNFSNILVKTKLSLNTKHACVHFHHVYTELLSLFWPMKTRAYSSFVSTCIFPTVIYPRAAVLYIRLYSNPDVHLKLITKTSLLTLSFAVDADHLKPKICLMSAQNLRVYSETFFKVMFHQGGTERWNYSEYATYIFKMSWWRRL